LGNPLVGIRAVAGAVRQEVGETKVLGRFLSAGIRDHDEGRATSRH